MNFRTYITTLLLAATTLPALAHFRTYTAQELNLLEELIGFERQTILSEEELKFSEQYGYQPDKVEGRDWDENPPKQNLHPWPSQTEFLQRLHALEQHQDTHRISSNAAFMNARHPITYLSPFEPDVELNYSYYRHQHFTGIYLNCFKGLPPVKKYICVSWNENLGSYYIQKFNVKPSREFYRFVMKFPAHELYDMGYEMPRKIPFGESEEGFAYTFPRTPRLFKK